MTQKSDPSDGQGLDSSATQDRSQPPNPPSSELDADQASEVGNIDKIRDILFGVQMQDYDGRFRRLEDQLRRVESELQARLSQRCEALERQMQQEIAALNAQLVTEQDARAEAVAHLVQDVKDLSVSFEAKTDQLAQQTDGANRELKQQLLEQSKQLSLEIQQKYTDISALLEKELQDLRHTKLDRNTLADLFGEAAGRLQR